MVEYTPDFEFVGWVDSVDAVQAGGPRGFNVLFDTIETEFQKIGQTVQTIDRALGLLGRQVSAPITIGLTPLLLPFGGNPQWSAIFWSRTSGGQPLGTFVEKPTAQDQAWGVLPLSLPNDVKLLSIKVLGEQNGAGDVVTDLVQELRVDPFTRATLITVNGLASAATTPTPIPGSPVFNGGTNLYYILIRVQNATNSTVRFRSVLITYQPKEE
jgi:hypothetical protein